MSPPIPAGVEEAAALTAHLDRVLGEGFARLAPALLLLAAAPLLTALFVRWVERPVPVESP